MTQPQRRPATPPDPHAIEAEVTGFLLQRSKKILGGKVERNAALFTSGLLDSLTFLELVVFVEEKFGVRLFSSMEVTYEALDSVEKVAEAVARSF
jgi:acyl carrier protein